MNINTHHGKNINWTVYKNGYNSFVCALLLNDEAYDISGLVFKMYFRRPNSSEDVLVLTEGEGLTNGGVLGTISVVLTADQLADLVRDRYFFVIEYTVSSKTYPLLQGYLQIKDETNPEDTTTSVTMPVNVEGVSIQMDVTLASADTTELEERIDALEAIIDANKPANTVLPEITGTAEPDEVLTVSTGTWTNNPTYAYQWQKDGVDIEGQTNNTYTVLLADVGSVITCSVTASNSFGSNTAESEGITVELGVLVPENTVLPAISGTAQVGETLTASTGTWINEPDSYSYQWKRGGSDITGETNNTYTAVEGDVDQTIAVTVTATNLAGSASATSEGVVVEAAVEEQAPSVFFATSTKPDVVDLLWISTGADNYIAERASDAEFSDAIQIYSGISTSFQDTGLVADTEYYYRIKHQITGQSDSGWTTTSVRTMFLDGIVAAYLPAGLAFNGVNDYGAVTSATITSLKSVINTSGPTLTKAGPGSLINPYAADRTPYNVFKINGAAYCDASADLALGSGAFEIDMEISVESGSVGAASQVFCDAVTGGNRLVRFTSFTGCYVAINNVFSTQMVFPIAWQPDTWTRIIIECDGVNIRSSCDGGVTWSNSVARPASGAAFNLNRMGASATGSNPIGFMCKGILMSTVVRSETERTRWFDLLKNSDYVNNDVDVSIVPSGLPSTFLPDPVGYIDFVTGIVAKGHGYGLSKNVYSIGDYNLLSVQKKITAPDYADAYILIHNSATRKVHTPILIGHDAETEDIHEKPSIHLADNSLWIDRMDRHYDGLAHGKLIVRKFGDRFNFTDFITIPGGKNVATTYFLPFTQYHQAAWIGNERFTFSHLWYTTSYPRYIMMGRSTDGGISYRQIPLIDSPTKPNWIYPILIESGNRNEIYLVVEHVLGGTAPVKCQALSIIKSSDGSSWTNIEGTFSKNIDTEGPVTDTELYANALILDARSLTSTLWSHGYCTPDGMLYGVVGDGSNSGWKLWRQSQGEAAILKDITFDGDTVVTGTQTDTMGTFMFAYHRSPIVALYKGGNTFDVVAAQVNGGNWMPTLYRTSDGGDNWVKIGVLPHINSAKQHTEFEYSQNYHFNNDKGVFTCSAADSSSEGKVYVIDVDEMG